MHGRGYKGRRGYVKHSKPSTHYKNPPLDGHLGTHMLVRALKGSAPRSAFFLRPFVSNAADVHRVVRVLALVSVDTPHDHR